MAKQPPPKHPDIFCEMGRPLGRFVVNSQEQFDEAAVKNKGRHGVSAIRVTEATTEIICCLQHLTDAHALDLKEAYRVVAKAIKGRHSLSAPLIHAAFTTACEHWPRGRELADIMLGREPG